MKLAECFTIQCPFANLELQKKKKHFRKELFPLLCAYYVVTKYCYKTNH